MSWEEIDLAPSKSPCIICCSATGNESNFMDRWDYLFSSYTSTLWHKSIGSHENFFCEHTSSCTVRGPELSFALYWFIGRATTAPLSRNYTNDIAWYVSYGGSLSLLCTVTWFGIPSTHSLSFPKEKKKGNKEGREGGRGKKNLKLFLSSGDLHAVARHAQPVLCSAMFCGNAITLIPGEVRRKLVFTIKFFYR